MPTWGGMLQELQEAQQLINSGKVPPSVSPFDYVRRKHLAALAARTKRNAILYATKWTTASGNPEATSIGPEDINGLMEVIHGLPDAPLDLIIHSPGGQLAAAESVVSYLRTKFSDIRVFVPHAAMSAACMVACSANRIVMGKHSFLGPIDPQFLLQTELGPKMVPVHAILAQFDMAQKQIAGNAALIGSWLPMLKQYGPTLLVESQLVQELARELVTDWLTKYMFANHADPANQAKGVATKLADHGTFKSHARFISRDHAKQLGLVVEDLEADQGLQEEVLSIFHAFTHTFNGTPAMKIWENHLGKAFLTQQQQVVFQVPPGMMPGGQPLPKPVPFPFKPPP